MFMLQGLGASNILGVGPRQARAMGKRGGTATAPAAAPEQVALEGVEGVIPKP